jgi:hypothetical protein
MAVLVYLVLFLALTGHSSKLPAHGFLGFSFSFPTFDVKLLGHHDWFSEMGNLISSVFSIFLP